MSIVLEPGVLAGGDLTLLTDADLLEAAQAGSPEAFSALYERHQDDLLRFCRRRLDDADDAADAVQETFLRAWRNLDGFGGERRVAPWLTTIAGNVCRDVHRRRRRTGVHGQLDEETADGARLIEELLAEADEALLAREALGRLSDRHRQVLELRECAEWSYERIAADQHLELNAVKVLLWRARQALRREFLVLAQRTNSFLFAAVGLLWAVRRKLGAARLGATELASTSTQLVAAAAVGAAVTMGAAIAAVPVVVHDAPPTRQVPVVFSVEADEVADEPTPVPPQSTETAVASADVGAASGGEPPSLVALSPPDQPTPERSASGAAIQASAPSGTGSSHTSSVAPVPAGRVEPGAGAAVGAPVAADDKHANKTGRADEAAAVKGEDVAAAPQKHADGKAEKVDARADKPDTNSDKPEARAEKPEAKTDSPDQKAHARSEKSVEKSADAAGQAPPAPTRSASVPSGNGNGNAGGNGEHAGKHA